jgi:hypothetical protein
MKYLLGVVIFLHGLIHCLGFGNAFGISEIKELTLPISKPVGIIWLTSAVLFLIYGLLYVLGQKNSWILGIVAIIASQLLIIYFWKDAKFGTLPNVIILIAVLFSYGSESFDRLISKEISEILSNFRDKNQALLSEHDIIDLPKPVQTWVLKSGAVGKEKIRVRKVVQKALMKMKPDQNNWYPATALQYTTVDEPAFIWTVEVKMNRLLRFRGRDKFYEGKGAMLIQ